MKRSVILYILNLFSPSYPVFIRGSVLPIRLFYLAVGLCLHAFVEFSLRLLFINRLASLSVLLISSLLVFLLIFAHLPVRLLCRPSARPRMSFVLGTGVLFHLYPCALLTIRLSVYVSLPVHSLV